MTLIDTLILCVYGLLVIHAVLSAMLQGKDPPKTLAWCLVIVALPVLGLLLYYFFGQNLTLEYRRRRRWRRHGIQPHLFSRFVRHVVTAVPPRYESLILMQKRACYALPYRASQIRLLTRGADFFDSLIADIRAARHHVHLEFFIFNDDATGRRLLQAMREAAARGVEVRLIYDHVGSWHTPSRFFSRMRPEGIDVVPFEAVHFRRLTHRVNYRNHRKICVIDGKVGYVGGMNVADRYVVGEGGRGWRDLMLRCQGTVVYGMQQTFLHDWYVTTHQFIASSPYYPLLPPLAEKDAEGATVQFVTCEPFGRSHNIMLGYNQLFYTARERILIQTPYFMPTQSVVEALQAAAGRGVHVQIMVPARMRSRCMQCAIEAYFGDMLAAGVEMYTYQPGFLHAKTVVIDSDFASVGSVNMDYRSLLDTFEDSLFIYDADVNRLLRDDFAAARRDCLRVEPALWRRRGLSRRFAESFMRVFAPLL